MTYNKRTYSTELLFRGLPSFFDGIEGHSPSVPLDTFRPVPSTTYFSDPLSPPSPPPPGVDTQSAESAGEFPDDGGSPYDPTRKGGAVGLGNRGDPVRTQVSVLSLSVSGCGTPGCEPRPRLRTRVADCVEVRVDHE